jgi:hypothetical protein
MATARPADTTRGLPRPGERRARLRWLAIPILAALTWSIAAHPWGWLYGLGVHPYPASSSTPWSYQLWSGLVPSLTVLTLIGALIGAYRLRNCKMERCPWLGHYTDSRGVRWCGRHHPDHQGEKPTSAMLHQLHFERLRALR